ncbi:hypothetical protein O988_07136 [Pseudogymnoascus sp. VKM F-3808]|nr:hypothetical protein O988_07136 [Pseudogymnoascus sp. VKM F-3808]
MSARPWLLYAYPWMPFPRRVTIYLREKRIPPSLVTVVPVSDPQLGNSAPPEFPPRPQGSLPILAIPSAHGSKEEPYLFIHQSLAIMNYLDELCDSGARQTALLALADECTIAWNPVRTFGTDAGTMSIPEASKEMIRWVRRPLGTIEGLFKGRDFSSLRQGGTQGPTIAEIVLYQFLEFTIDCYGKDMTQGSSEVVKDVYGRDVVEAFPKLGEFYAAFKTRDSAKRDPTTGEVASEAVLKKMQTWADGPTKQQHSVVASPPGLPNLHAYAQHVLIVTVQSCVAVVSQVDAHDARNSTSHPVLAANEIPALSSMDGAGMLNPPWSDGHYHDVEEADTVSFDQLLMPSFDGIIANEPNFEGDSYSNIPFSNLNMQGQGLSHDTENHATPDLTYQDAAVAVFSHGNRPLSPTSHSAIGPSAPPVGECPAPSHENIQTAPDTHDVHRAHIDAIGKVIACLDSHVQAGTVRIDEAMTICKARLATITEIMELDSYKLCTTCRTLISVSLELIVSLYETVVSSSKYTTSDSLHGSDKFPGLFFGGFEIGKEEHSTLRRRIVSTELQRPIPLLQVLSSGCCAAEGSDRRRRHVQYFSEIEDRITTLVSTLEV